MKTIKSRKAQAAMEFLLTYGWAILVVLAAIGALAYFGVLSPNRFMPSKCTMPAGIFCQDFNLEPDEITIVLMNSMGRDLIFENITVGNCTTPVNAKLVNGAGKTFILNCTNPEGTLKTTITLKYQDLTSGLHKSFEGDLQGEIKE